MKKLVFTNKGFTLIEALISLVITGILSLIAIPISLRLYDYHQLNQALIVLQSDLHYVRDFNMGPQASNQLLSILIYSQENRYDITIGAHGIGHISRQLPKNVHISSGYPILSLTFNRQGGVSSAQSIPIRSKYYSKLLVFSIGTGGFDIRDEK